jgi:hypothetical protein
MVVAMEMMEMVETYGRDASRLYNLAAVELLCNSGSGIPSLR